MLAAKMNFVQDEPVMIRRLGDGKEYRAKVVGVSFVHITDCYIVELVGQIAGNEWTHITIVEGCLDRA